MALQTRRVNKESDPGYAAKNLTFEILMDGKIYSEVGLHLLGSNERNGNKIKHENLFYPLIEQQNLESHSAKHYD